MSESLSVPMPATLASRPRDPRRDLPIPAVNEFPGVGRGYDFTIINSVRAMELARQRCCGLCGEPMPPVVAFLGGPRAAETGGYSDPPGCPACMRAALTLCPHIRVAHARRAGTGRDLVEAAQVPGFTGERPDTWVMVFARSYRIALIPVDGGGDLVPLYLPEQIVTATVYEYDENGALTQAER